MSLDGYIPNIPGALALGKALRAFLDDAVSVPDDEREVQDFLASVVDAAIRVAWIEDADDLNRDIAAGFYGKDVG